MFEAKWADPCGTPKSSEDLSDRVSFMDMGWYCEKDLVRHKVRHYPLQKGKEEVRKQENTNMTWS